MSRLLGALMVSANCYDLYTMLQDRICWLLKPFIVFPSLVHSFVIERFETLFQN